MNSPIRRGPPELRESEVGVWFTSDLHFGHNTLVRRQLRPFQSTTEMDEAIISNWQSCVKPGDHIFILGDLSFRKVDETLSILNRLPGQKHLIQGNHDKGLHRSCLDRFTFVKDRYRLKVGDYRIILDHYALRHWEGSHRGAWQLHGHSHGSLPEEPWLRQLDVGVDCWGFNPVPFEELIPLMAQKQWRPVDHHGEVMEDGKTYDS